MVISLFVHLPKNLKHLFIENIFRVAVRIKSNSAFKSYFSELVFYSYGIFPIYEMVRVKINVSTGESRIFITI